MRYKGNVGRVIAKMIKMSRYGCFRDKQNY